MRKMQIIAAAIVLLCSCSKDAIKEDAFCLFDDKALPSVSVNIHEAEWQRLLDFYDKDSRTKEYIHCDVTFSQGARAYRLNDVGLRLRGQTSRRRPVGRSGGYRHFHFGLHFRKFDEDSKQEIDGHRRINFKYAKEDPTYIREHYCHDLMARFGVWTAPKSSWCRLWLNVGENDPLYYGVYLMNESIDKQYLKRRPGFGSREGFLWKCAWGANLRDKDSWRFHLDDNSPDTYAYELKDDDPVAFEAAKDQLKDFITNLNTLKGDLFVNWIKQVCDVSLLLKTYAVIVAVGHWDDYWNDMNNFYIYFNTRETSSYRFYMIPFDYDNTLGTSTHCGVQSDSGRQSPYNWGLKECTLMSKILSVKEFRDEYTLYLKALGAEDSPFSYSQSNGRIAAWQGLIGPWLENVTGEDQQLRDRPASWGNHSEYRLLQDGKNNWFRVKSEVLNSLK